MTTLTELREMLAAADGPDDPALVAMMDKAIPEICDGWPWDPDPVDPAVIASIDAALAAVERLLPGWRKQIREDPSQWTAIIHNPAAPVGTQHYRGFAPTAPLAIWRAAVDALIEKEKPDDRA